jgi:hypothetical protein
MAATPRLTRLVGTTSVVANPRLTKLVGQTSGSVGVRLTKLSGQTSASSRVKLTSLSGRTITAAGAPTVTPPNALTVVSGALLILTASATASPGSSIASIDWRLVARDVGAKLPVFVETTGATIHVYLPVDLVPRSYTFGVTATDNAGRKSAEGTVVISAKQCDYLGADTAGWTAPVQDQFADAATGLWT